MTNILAGGGSFLHLLEHIGTATKAWSEDMKKHALGLNPEINRVLDAKVQESIGKVEMIPLQADRDHVLLELMVLKAQTSSFK